MNLTNSGMNTIQDCNFSNNYDSGMLILHSNGNYIINNTFINGRWLGLNIYGSNNNIVRSNILSGNQQYSILLQLNSGYNNVSENQISTNSGGIRVYYSNNNNITLNNISDSDWEGIRTDHSDFNIIKNNIINNSLRASADGIRLDYSENSSVFNNTIESSRNGIYLSEGSKNNTFSENNILRNSNAGLYLNISNENLIFSNNIMQNTVGISFNVSSNNKIYNNNINNTNNYYFFDTSYSNSWNKTKALGHTIIGGSYLGGNFWASPNGTGFSQTCADVDKDGICDSPYVLDGNNTDYLPLVINFTQFSGAIIGKFAYSSGTGIPGVTVNLTNASGVVTTTTTNSSGGYSFTNVITGNYNINASKPGFFGNSTNIVVASTSTVDLILWMKGDLNNNSISGDAGDLVLMKRAAIGEIVPGSSTVTPAFTYNLNNNGVIADAGDLVLMKRAAIGEIILS